MLRDDKTLRILIFFLAPSIIDKTWMHYQKHYSTLYHLNRIKSYLRGGRTTKVTDGYTYGMDGGLRILTGTRS